MENMHSSTKISSLQILVKAVRNVKKFGGGHILRRIYGWQNSARRNFFGGQIFGGG